MAFFQISRTNSPTLPPKGPPNRRRTCGNQGFFRSRGTSRATVRRRKRTKGASNAWYMKRSNGWMVGWGLPIQLVSGLYNCNHNQQVKNALLVSNESARGYTKAAFKVELDSKPFILKTSDYVDGKFGMDGMKKGSFHPQHRLQREMPPLPRNPSVYVKEIGMLMKFNSSGLPKLEGFCISKKFTWVLLEHAEDSLRALSTKQPNEANVYNMATSVVCLFSKYPQLGLGADAGGQQYAFTSDWQMKVVDLDILVTRKKYVENLKDQLVTNSCNTPNDCRSRLKKIQSGREVQRCTTLQCQNYRCSYDEGDFAKDTTCVLAEGAFKPLLRFGFSKTIFQACRGPTSKRPTAEQLLDMLCGNSPQCSKNNSIRQCT